MTNKKLFVEYLKYNNIVPLDFTEEDLPNWDMFNNDFDMSYDYYPDLANDYEDMAQRPNYRPSYRPYRRRNYRPGWGPGWGPNWNPNINPLIWWWLLF